MGGPVPAQGAGPTVKFEEIPLLYPRGLAAGRRSGPEDRRVRCLLLVTVSLRTPGAAQRARGVVQASHLRRLAGHGRAAVTDVGRAAATDIRIECSADSRLRYLQNFKFYANVR